MKTKKYSWHGYDVFFQFVHLSIWCASHWLLYKFLLCLDTLWQGRDGLNIPSDGIYMYFQVVLFEKIYQLASSMFVNVPKDLS